MVSARPRESAKTRGIASVSRRLSVIVLAAGLSACVSGGGNDWRIHYVSFNATSPQGNRVTVCHAYTCKEQTTYTFTPAQIAEISALMKRTKRADTPFEERRAVAYAISYMEVKVGNKLGIKDVAGMQFTASGDSSQQDCVDGAICSCSRRTGSSSTTPFPIRCPRRISPRASPRSIR